MFSLLHGVAGEYSASTALLEAATNELEYNSTIGGEAHTWLGLAYQVL